MGKKGGHGSHPERSGLFLGLRPDRRPLGDNIRHVLGGYRQLGIAEHVRYRITRFRFLQPRHFYFDCIFQHFFYVLVDPPCILLNQCRHVEFGIGTKELLGVVRDKIESGRPGEKIEGLHCALVLEDAGLVARREGECRGGQF